jgi:hypothetical protein
LRLPENRGVPGSIPGLATPPFYLLIGGFCGRRAGAFRSRWGRVSAFGVEFTVLNCPHSWVAGFRPGDTTATLARSSSQAKVRDRRAGRPGGRQRPGVGPTSGRGEATGLHVARRRHRLARRPWSRKDDGAMTKRHVHRRGRARAKCSQVNDRRPPGWPRLTAVDPTSEQAAADARSWRSEATVPALARDHPSVARPGRCAREPGRCRHGPSHYRLARGCGPAAPPWPPGKPTPNRPPAAERLPAGSTAICSTTRGDSPPASILVLARGPSQTQRAAPPAPSGCFNRRG